MSCRWEIDMKVSITSTSLRIKSIIIADSFRPWNPELTGISSLQGVYLVCSVTIASCLCLLFMIFVNCGLVPLALTFFSPSYLSDVKRGFKYDIMTRL